MFEKLLNDSSDEVIETSTSEVNLDIFFQLLHNFYPLLMNDSMYWAPEIYWCKIKQFTGIDIDDVRRICRRYHQDHKCKDCEEKHNIEIKKKLIDLFHLTMYKKQYGDYGFSCNKC